jgi:predicted PurR-regulated permease PerM
LGDRRCKRWIAGGGMTPLLIALLVALVFLPIVRRFRRQNRQRKNNTGKAE